MSNLCVDLIFEEAKIKLDDHQKGFVSEFFNSHVATKKKYSYNHQKHHHTVDSIEIFRESEVEVLNVLNGQERKKS